jgi:hypothetical protein
LLLISARTLSSPPPSGALGAAGSDTLFEYSRDFACPSDPTVYVNDVYAPDFPNVATSTELHKRMIFCKLLTNNPCNIHVIAGCFLFGFLP